MKTAFALPSTPTCKITYTRGGCNYGATVTTPTDMDGLAKLMAQRNVDLSAIKAIEPIKPRVELHRGHPAAQSHRPVHGGVCFLICRVLRHRTYGKGA